MEVATQQMTDETMQHSDTELQGLGLGNSEPIQNLDTKEDPIVEEEYTQGDYEGDLYQYEAENEKYKKAYEDMINGKMSLDHFKEYLTDEQKNTLGINGKNYNDNWAYVANGSPNQKKAIEMVKDNVQKKIKDNNQKIDNIKKNEGYDNRTEEQKREDEKHKEQQDREDSSYQRAEEDMRKAGLNPMLMFGGGSGASSSGGKNTEEGKQTKEKERAKKRQEEERARKERIERERQRIMSQMIMMLTLGAIKKV